MYKTIIILLILVAGSVSYFLHQFPYSILIAVIACSIFELAIQKVHHKRKLEIPYTAIISGIIIGSVAPVNTSLLILVLVSAVAILSKNFIKLKGSNIFNPSAFGLLIVLTIFGIGESWWIASPVPVYGVLIAFTPILAICAYDARRLLVGLSFAITVFVIPLLGHGLVQLQSLSALWTAVISVNYFLAFIMVSEPKTSPNKKHVQVIYGVGLGIIVSLMILYKVPYSLLLPLIIGNIAYAIYRIKSGSR
jgi:Na+-translocating ferredoxin:NAD+ oxidoreductase RnfD subunit